MLGLDPWEYRLKNANRIGDLAPCRVVLDDPSTVQTIQAVAEAVGKELSAEYRTMTNAEREGALPARAPRRPDGDGQPGQPLEVR